MTYSTSGYFITRVCSSSLFIYTASLYFWAHPVLVFVCFAFVPGDKDKPGRIPRCVVVTVSWSNTDALKKLTPDKGWMTSGRERDERVGLLISVLESLNCNCNFVSHPARCRCITQASDLLKMCAAQPQRDGIKTRRGHASGCTWKAAKHGVGVVSSIENLQRVPVLLRDKADYLDLRQQGERVSGGEGGR